MAVVLVVAAVSKLASSTPHTPSALTDRVPDYVIALLPWLEIGLAIWLISKWCRFGSWLTALALFALFAVHASLLTMAAKSSCGCLGDVTVPPPIILTADLSIVLLLLLGWPAWKGWPVLTPTGRTLLQTAGIAAALIGAAIGWAHAHYGSVHAAVSVARGDPATLTDSALNLGRVPANGSAVGILRVRNNTDGIVQIAMAASGCSCATVRDLPVNIAPGASADVSILVTVSAEPGEFRRSGLLHTSVGVLPYTIAAAVVPPPSEIAP